MHEHHSRGERHTHSHMRTYTHSINLSRRFFARHEEGHVYNPGAWYIDTAVYGGSASNTVVMVDP